MNGVGGLFVGAVALLEVEELVGPPDFIAEGLAAGGGGACKVVGQVGLVGQKVGVGLNDLLNELGVAGDIAGCTQNAARPEQ